jgi:hypothetical protein
MNREFFELFVLFVGGFAVAFWIIDRVIDWLWTRAEGYLARRVARRYLAAVHRDRTWRHTDRP